MSIEEETFLRQIFYLALGMLAVYFGGRFFWQGTYRKVSLKRTTALLLLALSCGLLVYLFHLRSQERICLVHFKQAELVNPVIDMPGDNIIMAGQYLAPASQETSYSRLAYRWMPPGKRRKRWQGGLITETVRLSWPLKQINPGEYIQVFGKFVDAPEGKSFNQRVIWPTGIRKIEAEIGPKEARSICYSQFAAERRSFEKQCAWKGKKWRDSEKKFLDSITSTFAPEGFWYVEMRTSCQPERYLAERNGGQSGKDRSQNIITSFSSCEIDPLTGRVISYQSDTCTKK